MVNMLVLYRGARLGGVEIVAVETDSQIIKDFARKIMDKQVPENNADPILQPIRKGTQEALKVIAKN